MHTYLKTQERTTRPANHQSGAGTFSASFLFSCECPVFFFLSAAVSFLSVLLPLHPPLLLLCPSPSFSSGGEQEREREREKVFFFHSTQASTFPLYSFQQRSSVCFCARVICVCVCVCIDSQQPLCPSLLPSFPCALSLYHHIFPWQINFTHDQPTPLATLGPAVIKRREITIYIILMQTSFSR